jgi:hypothetical protein
MKDPMTIEDFAKRDLDVPELADADAGYLNRMLEYLNDGEPIDHDEAGRPLWALKDLEEADARYEAEYGETA